MAHPVPLPARSHPDILESDEPFASFESFDARLTDGASSALPVLAAVVASFIALYRGRENVPLAIQLHDAGGLRRTLSIDLTVTSATAFSELVRETRNLLTAALADSSPTSDGPLTSEDTLAWYTAARWNSERDAPTADSCELEFSFLDSRTSLQLEFRPRHAARHRLSPQMVAETLREAVKCVERNPTIPIGAISWVSATCRRRILTSGNGTPIPYDARQTILHLFHQCVERYGSAPAITFGRESVTYSQLDGKANALATQLRARGVRRGDLIPVVMRNGLELPISMIALMKLGAAFVPVDPDWPHERLRVILDGLRAPLALYADPPVEVTATPALHFRAAALDICSTPFPHAEPLPDDIIYGFFTSGSTGVPKCALNYHRGVLNRFLAMNRRFGADQNDVVLQNSRAAFDSSIWQLLWPLTNGSQVVIPDAGSRLDLNHAISLIERHGVTMTDFVPSIFNTFVDLLEADRDLVPRLQSLRHLLIGGEAIGCKAVQTFRSLIRGCTVTNTYGPTEASIGCVFHEVSDQDGWSIPIGRPIDNCYVAILDARQRVVPAGVIGEVFIGGDCLGRGYLNDPAKTAAAFVPNGLQEIPGYRLYRTGDFAYQGVDGNIRFVGRADQQVKVGGVRIELTEIEKAIAAHPGVRAATAIVDSSRPACQSIIAYAVADPSVLPAGIRQTIARSLPASSMPRHIFVIDRMPLNPNGKADRDALKAMASANRHTEHGSLTETERRIRNVWIELLGVGAVALDDDFFGAGGDSLIATQLGLRLRAEFKRGMHARDIYRFRTIREQAQFIEHRRSRTGIDETPDLISTLHSSACLGSDIAIGPASARETPAVILITGGTGFIGSHVLQALLNRAPVRVVCLVRAPTHELAAHRLSETLRQYCLDGPQFVDRVRSVAGDISQPRLGLTDDVYEELARSVDAVVHCGAKVDFLLDYAALSPANVDGTREVIRFAAHRRRKAVHHISSLATVPISSRTAFPETELSAGEAFPSFGYGQSKSVAERLLADARARGLSTVTYRLGEVMPHSVTGIANARSLLDMLIRSCLSIGVSFNSSLQLDYTTVDYVAQFLAAAVTASSLDEPVFHVFHSEGVSLNAVFDGFRAAGFDLEETSYERFHATLRSACEVPGADRDLLLTLALIPDPGSTRDSHCELALAEIVRDAGRHYSCDRTQTASQNLGVAWNVPREQALGTYIAFHRRQMGSVRGARAMSRA